MPEPSTIRILGFTIKLEADLLSLSSFMLSILAVVFSAWGILQGPVVEMSAPDQITLWTDKAGWVHLIAELPITTTTPPGHLAVIEKQLVTFVIARPNSPGGSISRTIELTWQNRTQSHRDSNQQLNLGEVQNASRITIDGGAVISIEHDFTPRHARDGEQYRHFLTKADLLVHLNGCERMEFIFTSKVYARRLLPWSRTLQCKVSVKVDDTFRKNLEVRDSTTTSAWDIL